MGKKNPAAATPLGIRRKPGLEPTFNGAVDDLRASKSMYRFFAARLSRLGPGCGVP
jgi:hypothetical protein